MIALLCYVITLSCLALKLKQVVYDNLVHYKWLNNKYRLQTYVYFIFGMKLQLSTVQMIAIIFHLEILGYRTFCTLYVL